MPQAIQLDGSPATYEVLCSQVSLCWGNTASRPTDEGGRRGLEAPEQFEEGLGASSYSLSVAEGMVCQTYNFARSGKLDSQELCSSHMVG